MLAVTHALISATSTALVTGTIDPIALGIAACASQLPDIDLTSSYVGRIFFPISRLLETYFPHRTITHSFPGTAVLAVLALPVWFIWSPLYYIALVLGFMFGWLADCFTKSGVAAFYPINVNARLVIPGNINLRLATGLTAEYGVLVVVTILFVATININSSGGMVANFTQLMGQTSGAAEFYLKERDNHLVIADIKGYHLPTGKPISGKFEIVDMDGEQLIVASPGGLLKTGQQIKLERITTETGAAIRAVTTTLQLVEESPADRLAELGQLPRRTYISGQLELEDGEDLTIPTPVEFHPTIEAAVGVGVQMVHLKDASPEEVTRVLGDYYCTGSLLIRSIYES